MLCKYSSCFLFLATLNTKSGQKKKVEGFLSIRSFPFQSEISYLNYCMDERQIIEKWTNEMIRSSQLAAIRRETETKTQKIK